MPNDEETKKIQKLETEKRCLKIEKKVLETLARFEAKVKLIMSDGWCD